MLTMSWLESPIAERGGPRERVRAAQQEEQWGLSKTYLKEMPYWETASYPDFHTSVTSQAFVAWSLHERKAETAFPPTEQILISNVSSMFVIVSRRLEACEMGAREGGVNYEDNFCGCAGRRTRTTRRYSRRLDMKTYLRGPSIEELLETSCPKGSN